MVPGSAKDPSKCSKGLEKLLPLALGTISVRFLIAYLSIKPYVNPVVDYTVTINNQGSTKMRYETDFSNRILIGKGGSGSVYRATPSWDVYEEAIGSNLSRLSTMSEIPVVLFRSVLAAEQEAPIKKPLPKVVSLKVMKDCETWDSPSQSEIEILASLMHENITRVFDCFQENGYTGEHLSSRLPVPAFIVFPSVFLPRAFSPPDQLLSWNT
jgi:hypothetical protein